MSQSLVQNFMHIIFSTKNREPLIRTDIEKDLYQYIAATCSNFQCHAQQIGGHLDHVHVLCNVSKNISIADFIKELKTSSSKWIKYKYAINEFYWQSGYAAFSIQYRNIEIVNQYIRNQHEHHGGCAFKDELRSLLNENNIAFDERYIWD